MPTHFRENQYQGINAHLQSALQSQNDGWEVFHAAHITHLTDALDAILPDGYYVLNEKSLQLSTFNLLTDTPGKSRTRPDLGIYQDRPSTGDQPVPTPGSPSITLPIVRAILEEDPLEAAIIYRAEAPDKDIPVTRIELLSPGNKEGGTHYPQYLSKRNETLDAGINLVEIDYLHESRSLAWSLPSYPDHEDGAYPYTILVSDPHPSIAEGRTEVYGFDVDQALRPVSIPLAQADRLTLDFAAVYNTTFSRNRYYGTRIVDYEQLPARFETYSEDDQLRIRERMRLVATTTSS